MLDFIEKYEVKNYTFDDMRLLVEYFLQFEKMI